MAWKLFLDDERFPPNDGGNWKIARSEYEVVQLVAEFGLPNFVSFDHDLGDEFSFDRHGYLIGSGMTVAKYLCAVDRDTYLKMPDDFNFYVHSQNPVGRDNIVGYINGYMNFREEYGKNRLTSENN